jgi:hypothetical protein
LKFGIWSFGTEESYYLSNNPSCNIFSPGNGTGYSPSKQAAQ